MRVRVSMPTADGKKLREKIREGAEKVEEDEMGQTEWEIVSPFLRLLVPISDPIADHAY
jgi:hypothetical protein